MTTGRDRLDEILREVRRLIDEKENDRAGDLLIEMTRSEFVAEALSLEHLDAIFDIAIHLDRLHLYYFAGEVLEIGLGLSIDRAGEHDYHAKLFRYEYAENLRLRQLHFEAVYNFTKLYEVALESGLPPNLAGLLYKNLGLSLVRDGNLEEARAVLTNALSHYKDAETPEVSKITDIVGGLVEVDLRQGRFGDVISRFEAQVREAKSGGQFSFGAGQAGMTAIAMHRAGGNKHYEWIMEQVNSAIVQCFESNDAFKGLAFYDMSFLYEACFQELLDTPDNEKFITHLKQYVSIAKLGIIGLGDVSNQTVLMGFTSRVSTTLDAVLSVIVERPELQIDNVMSLVLELGQTTKGAITRLLSARKLGSRSTRSYETLRDWYAARVLDQQNVAALRNYEVLPSLDSRYIWEHLDRKVTERITDWNMHRALFVDIDHGADGANVLEYFTFTRRRPGRWQDEPEDWIVSILRTSKAHGNSISFNIHGRVKLLAQTIDDLRQALFLTMQLGDRFQWRRKAEVAGKVLLPPLPVAGDRERLVIVPDSELHLVPFDVLRCDVGGQLCNRFAVSFVQSSHDLISLHSTRGVGLAPVCIGNPNFDMPDNIRCLDEDCWDARLGVVWATLDRRPFEALEDDEHDSEVEEVARIVGVEPLKGVEASATELLRVNAPSILHVSTHGFYLSQSKIHRHLHGSTTIRNTPERLRLNMAQVFQNPQNRCGLIFAGANVHLEGGQVHPRYEEGFVFATEIEELDLRHTELVTLSACVTGVGDDVDGDGIAGVRRAFLGAGVASVISTIWDVPVDSTREFFTRFYAELKGGLSRLDAFERARSVIASAYPGEDYRYCGFQLHGEIGPLEYFTRSDRIIISRGYPSLSRRESRNYSAFLAQMTKFGIAFEGTTLETMEVFRTAYSNGVWSISALRELVRDDAIPMEIRERFWNEFLKLQHAGYCYERPRPEPGVGLST